MNKFIWNYKNYGLPVLDSYDSYWSVNENRIYDKKELQTYQDSCIKALLSDYIINNNQTEETEEALEVDIVNNDNTVEESVEDNDIEESVEDSDIEETEGDNKDRSYLSCSIC